MNQKKTLRCFFLIIKKKHSVTGAKADRALETLRKTVLPKRKTFGVSLGHNNNIVIEDDKEKQNDSEWFGFVPSEKQYSNRKEKKLMVMKQEESWERVGEMMQRIKLGPLMFTVLYQTFTSDSSLFTAKPSQHGYVWTCVRGHNMPSFSLELACLCL
ncbi:hypothetical protein DNTS_000588 [Danionella cerebrum]|uniref:Uncharacterized protein n=1 Tax=Danionella cerebrum TaxID=2873325 RepID=A0A553NWJ9_9TELE|nr:hypothetical protein DNTS_000588 [Danionella translucida]